MRLEPKLFSVLALGQFLTFDHNSGAKRYIGLREIMLARLAKISCVALYHMQRNASTSIHC